MRLHNTRTKKVEPFTSLKDDAVRMYSCGPTVYDNIHIGNLSSFIFADTLRRVLISAGFDVNHLMNFTDVDDKTIKRSRENYPDMPAKEALQKLTEHYSEVFLEDMRRIGNDIGSMSFIKATASIKEIQQLIEKLLAQKIAYTAEDGIYFSINAYKKSGKTYGQLIDVETSNTSEARIDNDEYDKESAHDFALWKKQRDGEPAWEFAINGEDYTGRPGWHIECSAMSKKGLGLPFDIHTGGIDLIFPHHENEIAQSTAAESNPLLATFFVHNEHLLIDGKKMSKSLNNFYTLEDIIKKGFEPLSFRLLVLQAHYRSQTNFTWESLEAAQNRLRSLRTVSDLRFQPLAGGVEKDIIETTQNKMQTTLENDLATPQALALLSDLSNDLEAHGIAEEAVESFTAFLRWLDDVFGLKLSQSKDIKPAEQTLISDREAARKSKDWEKSDQIRDELLKQGIGLRDTSEKTIWFRV